MLFHATVSFYSVCSITPQFLATQGVKGLLLDIDNTLTTHDNPVPADGVLDWIATMKQNGIAMMLVSNNHAPRVQPFAELLGLPFVCEGRKPLSRGFREAQARMQLPFSQLAVVGDQLFTDILGANLKGLTSFYVRPIAHEQTAFFKLKRTLERPFLPKTLLGTQEEKK